MTLLHHTISAIYFVGLFFPSLAVSAVCDRSKEPWLSDTCDFPSGENPDHACRVSAFLKSIKVAPDSIRPWDTITITGQTINYESYDNLAWTTCENVKKLRCSTVMNSLLEKFQLLQDAYISIEVDNKLPLATDNQSEPQSKRDGNLTRNFDYLDSKGKSIVASLQDVNLSMQSVATTAITDSTLFEANRILSSKLSPIRDQLTKFNISLKIFDALRNDFAKNLAIMNAESIGATNNFDCKSYEAEIEKYNSNVKRAVDMSNDMTTEIFGFGKQINSLFNETYFKWRYQIYRQYAFATKKDVNQLIDGLRADLQLDTILWDVSDWWVSATINGLAGRLHTKYYFFSEPLRILRIERTKALLFKNRISSVADAQKNTRDVALKSIDDKIASIDQSILFIESRGWEGLLNLQILSAKKRAELLPNNLICQSKTSVFLLQANSVNSLVAFDAASPLYKETVDVCIK